MAKNNTGKQLNDLPRELAAPALRALHKNEILNSKINAGLITSTQTKF